MQHSCISARDRSRLKFAAESMWSSLVMDSYAHEKTSSIQCREKNKKKKMKPVHPF